MKVKVKLFAGPREAVGGREIERELPPGSTAGQLVDLLMQEYPVLDSYSRLIKIAVNRRYVAMETELQDGDEVACIPPVAGG